MNTEISNEQFQGELRSVGLFIDNAKTYIQLSTGALLLSVTFSKSINDQVALSINELYLWVSWLCWLAVIILGATYQYCAVKYLEALEEKNGSLYYDRVKPFVILRHWSRNPYKLYGALMVFFYVGTIWFAVSAAIKLGLS